ncbi:hypothetical protein ILUMI_08612 [Ignelater luminosus]|uniref:Nuclear speckle splicing regulatory protein 1 N-terminal domain-containing protein n=1 Tax=Ignelater luminosus TaxID=2038154 RepID=A0A8K0D1B9_IGNLU|nr:hypothetical protein ILUMI_08612 [Ignelater luminosus]
MSKQYGLIVPNKNKSLHPMGVVRPTSVFGDDSDSDSGSAKPTGLKTALKRQDRLLQEKAVEEDPTVYQYDELYDEMDAKRKESKLSRKDLDKKPKYINKLLATAERRKRENERRIERQVQKEREAEGEEFKDKESFVTSAYRAKLEELKKLDEEEQREEYLEAIGDVKKQGNLDGFYRHLYDQKVLYEDKINAEEEEEKRKLEIKEESEGEKTDEAENKDDKTNNRVNQRKRKYRKRDESSESEPNSPQREVERNLQHLPSNIDADSDFSIDSSDTDEEGEAKKTKEDEEGKDEKNVVNKEIVETKPGDKNEQKTENIDDTKGNDKKEEKEEVKVVKPKINIWKKRTVDAVFDEALKRYFERKALREAGTYVRPTL